MKKYIIPASAVINVTSEGMIAASQDSTLKVASDGGSITTETGFGTHQKESNSIWSHMDE